ncbi:hypothetical protein AB0F81_06815 [Actinoplanes sp. NPDC024001]|uniref:hypothetical protein n=1 Tax=Actinoplanes sp. NPDC024001 TaxID=3154598 RepID=UPI0033C9FD0F
MTEQPFTPGPGPSAAQPAAYDGQPAAAGYPPLPAAPASRPVFGWVALGAGIAAIIGSFLPWAKMSAPIIGQQTVAGVDGTDGWITVGLGAVLAVYAGLVLRGQGLPVAAPIIAAVTGLGLSALAVWKIVDLYAKIDEMKKSLVPEGDDPFGIAASLSAAVSVSVGAGLWLITAAGIAGLVSAVALMLRR